MRKAILTLIAASTFATMAFAQPSKTATLEERVAELEANSSLNIFSFRGSLITRWDDLSAKQSKGAPTLVPYDYKGVDYWRMKFSLDADANISKNIQFYSRFSAAKFFNNTVRQDGSTTQPQLTNDLTVVDAYLGPQVYLEKAYADIAIPDSNFIFSMGRLPTVDGTPYDYYDNRARMGTYPMLSYNSPLDGFSLTYRLDSYLPEKQKMAIRLLYTPFSQVRISDDNAGPYVTPPASGGSTSNTGNRVNSNVDGYAGQIDYSLLETSFADTANFIFQYISLNALAVGNDLSLQFNGATTSLELKGIAGSRLDFSASVLQSVTKSRGAYAAAGGAGYGVASGNDDLNGTAALATLRYRFIGWHIGGEYFNGTKYAFVYHGAAKDLTNFYSTPGDGTHLFITKNFTDLLSLRLGTMQQNYKYTPISVGPSYDSDKKITTYYANMRLDF